MSKVGLLCGESILEALCLTWGINGSTSKFLFYITTGNRSRGDFFAYYNFFVLSNYKS